MITSASLTGSHLRTYQTLFQHPVPQDLTCRDIIALLEEISCVTAEPNGDLKVARNGQSLIFLAPHINVIAGTDEILAVRHFLVRSEAADPAVGGSAIHWLLVIDHHEARVFRLELGAASAKQVLSRAPADLSHGHETPAQNSFFESVVKALQNTGQILVCGEGKGTSSEMDRFVAWSKRHHPELAGRIIGSKGVDAHHLTEGQLLAQAREYFAAHSKNPL